MSELKVSDLDPDGKPATGDTPQGDEAPKQAQPMPPAFVPINPPPTNYHNFGIGLSSENGDDPKTVSEKINAGFKHVYALLMNAGHAVAAPVETPDLSGFVPKAEFDALAARAADIEARFNALAEKMEKAFGLK